MILRLFFVCFYTYVGIISSRVQQAGVCACVCALARVFSLLWKIKISNWPSPHCLFKVKVEATHAGDAAEAIFSYLKKSGLVKTCKVRFSRNYVPV